MAINPNTTAYGTREPDVGAAVIPVDISTDKSGSNRTSGNARAVYIAGSDGTAATITSGATNNLTAYDKIDIQVDSLGANTVTVERSKDGVTFYPAYLIANDGSVVSSITASGYYTIQASNAYIRATRSGGTGTIKITGAN